MFDTAPRRTIDAGTESPDAFCSVAGTGALEREQQEPSGAAVTLALPSSMVIWSHCDCVRGVAHSTILEVKTAQADRGTGPSPSRLSAKAKMSDRRTMAQFSKGNFPSISWKVSSSKPSRSVKLVTFRRDSVA